MRCCRKRRRLPSSLLRCAARLARAGARGVAAETVHAASARALRRRTCTPSRSLGRAGTCPFDARQYELADALTVVGARCGAGRAHAYVWRAWRGAGVHTRPGAVARLTDLHAAIAARRTACRALADTARNYRRRCRARWSRTCPIPDRRTRCRDRCVAADVAAHPVGSRTFLRRAARLARPGARGVAADAVDAVAAHALRAQRARLGVGLVTLAGVICRCRHQ